MTMDLTDRELQDLAAFFSRRLTPECAVRDPLDAPPPGIDPVVAWTEELIAARDKGTLDAVVRRVHRALPDDAAVAEACRLLTRRQGTGESLVLGVVLAGGAVALMLSIAGGVTAVAGLTALEAATTQSVLAAASTAPLPYHLPDELGAEAPASTAPAKSTPTYDPPFPTLSAGTVSAPRAHEASGESRGPRGCRASDGSVVGYWYAGRARPGALGDTVRVPHSVHVRAQVPSRDNGWSARATVRCTLGRGDRVLLRREPIDVGGGHWWVPLVAGAWRQADTELALR